MRKLMLFLAVFGFSTLLLAQDPTMGTFKLNLAKSKVPAGEAANVKETVMVFREIEGNIMEAISTETLKDGKTNTMKWTTPMAGGLQTYREGGPAKGVSTYAVKLDPHTIYNVSMQDGKQVGLFKINFSKDFQTFTINATGTDAQGKPWEYLVFYERQ